MNDMKKNLKKFIAMVLTVATVASTVPVGNVFATSPDLQGSPATSSEMEVETEEGGQTVPEESQEAETKAEESKETDQKNEEKQTEEANQPDTKEQKTEESTAKQEEPKSGKTYTVRLVDDSEYGLLSFPDMDPVMADEDDPLAAMEAFIKQLEEEESEDTFKAGEEVTVVVASEMGYEMESVSVRGVESGKDYDFEYDEENGEVKLPMPKEDIEVSAEFGELKLEEEETESTAPAMARAATAAAAPRASKKITLKVPSTRFYYGAYSTHPYTTSEGEYAYCLIPRKPAQKAGSYTASEITNTNARKAFYYAYGGPGYATYKSRYGNIGNGSQRYEYSYSHVILSYVYSKYVLKSNTEANYAFYGLSSSVKKSLINKANKMIGMSAPPSYYECYYFTTAGKNGSSSRAQPMGAQIVNQGQLTLKKSSNNTGITSGNNLYSLNGAQYGVYSNKACTSKVGTLTTNSSGQANTLTLNKGTYYIKETKAPKGYQLSTTVTTATVKSSALTTAKVSDTPINDPAAITIYKRDKVTGDKVQGSASLAGAQFTVNYYAGYYEEDNLPAKPTRYWVLETKEVKTSSGDSVYRAALLDEYKVGGNAFYKSAGGNETIPLGTVTIQETKAPDGYNNDLVMTDANGNKKDGMYLVQIKKEGDMTALTGGNTFIAEDTVVRGDFSFTKVNGDTGRKMANIPFKITNTKTGESHTVYTDSDGYFSTESSYVKHSENTNGEKAGSGTWFGDLESMDDSLGAMPYGAYTIEEQICDANRGLILYEGSFTIDEKTDGKTLELGTIVNNSIQISTYAMSMNSEGNAAWLGVEDGSWDISDTITVEGLDRGIVEAYLVDKETGERLKDKNGNDIMASAEVFDGFGYVQFGDIDNYPHPMEGIIDYEDLVGKDIVVYDYIYEMKSNGQPDYTKPIVQHTDLNDEYQTINFSALKTELTEETSGSHYVTNTGKEVTLVDNVTIENLPEMFELNTLWLKLEGKLLDENGNPAKDASGKEITATTGAFKIDSNAELNDGFELTYHLDAATVKKYEGQTLTATARFMATFEDYETGDPYDPWLGIIAQETELDNPAQTVTFPAITSTTVSKDVISPTDKTVSDKVNLDGLIPGDTYTLSGVIVDKETGEPIGGKVLDKTYGVDDYDVSYVEPGEDANYTVVENDTFRIYNLQVEDVGYEGGCYRYAKDGDQEGYFRCEEDGTLIDGAEPIDKETFETTVLYPGETFTERHDNRQTFTFTADAESMTQYMTFEIDPEELAGGAYVIQEQLYLGEAQEITIDLDTDTSQQPEEEEGQAYAVFYSDGSLTFQRGSEPKDPNGVVATFTGFEDSNLVPWKSYMKSIESVAFVDEIHPVSTAGWFNGALNLSFTNFEKLNTENVTDMSRMFYDCSALTSLDVSGFDTANVENMESMFYNCSGIKTLAVENFKTGKVTSMGWMFRDCSGLTALDVSGFDTANVENMQSMFYNCSGIKALAVENFKTGKVTSMSWMFRGCSGLTDLDVSGFNTENVTQMESMFAECSNLTSLNVSGLNTANVENMKNMFYNCSGIKALAVENFKTSKVTSMGWMFYGCSGLTNLDVSGFNTENVTQMKSMFSGCTKLTTLNVSGFKTSNVTDMSYMFNNCSGLTALDVSGFDTANVENMEGMFQNCSKLKALAVENFKTGKVTSTGWMFHDCSGLTALDVSGFDTENVTQMKSMFAGCTKLTTLNVSGFKTSNVTDMSYMFDGCSGLTALDVSGFDTANVENMESMFQNCSKLKALAVENFKTGKVTSMGWMFFECHALSSLNASGFDTSKVTNMYCMFQNCKALTGSIKISGSACTNYQYMFFNCSSNRGKKMTVYNDGKNASLVSKMIATKNNGNVVSGGTKKSVAAMTLAANSDVANAKEETKSNLTPETTQTKAVNQSLNGGAPSSAAAPEPAPSGAAPSGETSGAAEGSDTVVANYLAFMETVRSAMTLSGPVKSADEDFLQLLSSHESLDDANQTFYVPEIDTVLKDKESQDKFYTPDSSVSLTDIVSYRGLKPGKSYTLMAQLINKDTGMVAQDADGAYLTTTKTFTPSKAEGTVDVEFAFDGSNLNGVTLVAYESLSGEAWSYGTEGKQYVFAQHQDLNDEDQTVNNMLIDTKVSADKTGTTMVYAETGAAVTDTVILQGTASGKNYRVEGRIVDQETGETVTDGAGKEITAAVDFTGKAGSQSVTVNYSFDASTMAGGKYVVFESVYLMDGEEKILMATHEDLADKDQTFTVPKIETNLYDASTMTNISYPGDNIELRDILSYTGLEPGKTYTVSSRLVHQDTGETYVDGDGKSMDLKDHFQFTPEESDGDVEVSIPINGSNLSGCLVAYQTVTLNGDMIGKHEDITSETQTLFVPGIQTSATDKETGSKYIKADPEMTIVDAVTFENMQDGMAVILKATLMDKETGEALKDANGDPITAEHEFVPDGTSGTENVEITFDGTNLKGKTVVVFEEAWMGDLLVAQHKDLTDEAQTLKIPGISTSAVNQETGDRNGILGEEMTIEDTVTYRNLDPGTEYRLDAVLYNKDTGKPYLDSGKTITATKTFTPAAADGEEQVTLTFNRDEVGASGLVVFETLTMVEKDIVVAEHHDIKDANQTITMKGIKLDTVATEKGTGAKQAQAKDSVTLTDKVSYENLKAGKEYSLVTYLLEQASGDPVGERVTTSFTPEKSSGSVTTEISFDGTGMAGKAVVVCQELHDKDGMIMAHADLEDKDQTIKLHNITLDTVATDSKTGTHYAFAEKDMVIQDTVSYQGLGDVEYRLESYLVDQETEKAVSDTVKTTFTPAAESGELTVKIPVDGTSLAGKQIVAYQKLYEGTELIAVHMDPDDADQTILIPGITTNAVNQETGEKTSVSGPLTIEDTVTYRNLEAGADYRLDAKVMVKETGEALKVDGKEVTASKEFTADSANGSETVVIPVDASDTGLIGKTLVVYETLTRVSDQSVVAVHHDINDKAQSILIQPPLKRDAEVTKRILAADFWAEHGNPTFIFEMKGTDINGDPHTYYRSVEFTEEYVKAHTDPDGYVEMTVTFNDVMAGEYVVSEVEVSRYEFDSISDLVNAQAKDDTAIYDLINNDTAASTFTNRKYEWQDYSSNDIVVNHIEAAE